MLLFILLFCAVARGAEGGDVPICDETKALLHKIEAAMDDRNALFVAFVRGAQLYTASYDVSGEKNRWVWFEPPRGESRMIMPVMDALQNEALRGFMQRSRLEGDFQEELREAGCSLDQKLYQRCSFFSENYRLLLMYWLPRLEEKGQAESDDFGQFLTKSMLQGFCLGGGALRFSIVEPQECVREVFSAEPIEAGKIFIPMPNVGVVKGELVSSTEVYIDASVVPSQSFLSRKMSYLLIEMTNKYPYSAEMWKTCLNYKEGCLLAEGKAL